MATLTDPGFPNLANLAQRMGPNGEYREMCEVLNKQLDILDDIPWVECNLDLGHQVSYRTGLPSPQWRKINQGVTITKTTGETFIESTGMIEDRAEVDVDAPGNIAQLRRQEEAGKIEMMSQEFARALFYESTVNNAERIHGLSPRYGATSGYTASSYVARIGSAGSGDDNESIWLISWKPGKVYGIYPKGSPAGLFRKDLGEIDCFESSTDTSKKFRGLATKLQWKCGIAVEDYRYSMRMQYDPGDALAATTAKGLYLGMQDALGTVFKLDENARFYMSRATYKLLNAQLANNTQNFLEYVASGGKRIPVFMGVPIRITDALVVESPIV